MNLGVQLRVYRKSKNHSVQKVSELTGISADKIYKWEKGTRPSDAEDLLKIRDYMAGNWKASMNEVTGKLESKQTEIGTFAIAAEGPAELPVLKMLLQQYESRAEELKADKDRLYKIIENYLNTLLANSNQNKDHLLDAKTILADIIAPQVAELKLKLDAALQVAQPTSVAHDSISGKSKGVQSK